MKEVGSVQLESEWHGRKMTAGTGATASLGDRSLQRCQSQGDGPTSEASFLGTPRWGGTGHTLLSKGQGSSRFLMEAPLQGWRMRLAESRL